MQSEDISFSELRNCEEIRLSQIKLHLFLMNLAATATQTDFVFKGACQNIVALACDLFFLLVIFIYILEWLVVCRRKYS